MNGAKSASSSLGLQSSTAGIGVSFAGTIYIISHWISDGFHGVSQAESVTLAMFIILLASSVMSWIGRYRATKVITPITFSK